MNHFGVKSRRNFVKQHYLGVHNQTAANRHTLFLSARKLCGITVRFIGQSYTLQKFHCSLFDFRLVTVLHFHRAKHYVFEHGQMREKVIALKHHTDFLTDFVQALVAVDDRLAVKRYRTALYRLQAVDTSK